MWRVSTFNDYYNQNKSEIDKDAEDLSQKDFMQKYHIGTLYYNMYFRGKSKVIERRISKRIDELVDIMKEKAKERLNNDKRQQYDDRTEYYRAIEEIALKNNVTVHQVKKASEDYTISELRSAIFVNWKPVCNYTVEMKKPSCIEESMYSYNCGMV